MNTINTTTPIHVLIVDDDNATRLITRTALEQAGFRVDEAGDGLEALKRFDETHHDLLLLDVHLPGLDGFGVCEQIRSTFYGKYTPIIMVTGLDDIASIEKAYTLGATDFMIKPINWTLLSHHINYVLRARATEEKVKYLAYYDGLTGLPNRSLFGEHLSAMIKHASRQNTRIAVLFLDLDNFKRVNDSLGHTAGDELLQIVAERLLTSLRDCDVVSRDSLNSEVHHVARLGGDEFIIFLDNNISPTNAQKVAQRVIHSLNQPVVIERTEIPLSVSIGIAMYPEDGNDTMNLMKNADTAMYHAKESGKNNFSFYAKNMNAQALSRLCLERDLQKALEYNEFTLLFQPIIDIQSKDIVSAEALIRWNHPEKGLILPDQFISLAEETNMISEIGAWTIYQALEAMQLWQQEGFNNLRVAVNLSPRQLTDNILLPTISRALQEFSLTTCDLEFELTENMLMDSNAFTLQQLQKIKALGITLAIDDFGTGYSSLRYLSQFPIDTLKIDKSFIAALPDSRSDVSIIQAIIALAHSLKLRVVGEGVENELQYKFLQSHHCDLLQGFYFSKPLTRTEMLEYLRVCKPEPLRLAHR
jgi:diguanylate cyclase (GGDEF)-like protein